MSFMCPRLSKAFVLVGLCDTFNYLIYHSTDYDRQILAAYKYFEDYRLFDDGYVESLLTAHLNQEGYS